MNKRGPGRPVVPSSVGQIEKGYTGVRIGIQTHARLATLAAEENTSIAAVIARLSSEAIGDSGQSTFTKRTEPISKLQKSLEQTSQLSRVMASMLILGQPASWLYELKEPGTIMQDLLPETRLQIEEAIKWATSIKTRQVAMQKLSVKLSIPDRLRLAVKVLKGVPVGV